MSIAKRRLPTGAFGTWADFWRPLLLVALPITAQNLVSSSLHIIDNLMVGALGDVALAGVSQANQVQFVLRLFMFGVASGATILIAQHWGNKDVAALRRTVGLMTIGTLSVGLVGFLAALLFPRTILGWFIHDDAAMAEGLRYLTHIAPAYLFSAIVMALGNANKATERAVLPMLTAILSIGLNTFLNWCLIYGNLGFPALGVEGAAIATVIAVALDAVLLIVLTWALRYPIAGKPRELLPKNREETRTFFKVGVPVILNEGLWGLGTSIYAVVYGIMGTTTVAAMAIFGVVDQLVWALGWGFMTGTAVLVGKRIGAGDLSGARQMSLRLLVLTAAIGFVVGAGLVLPLSGRIGGLFSASPEAKAMASNVLTVFGVVLFIKMFNATNVVGVLRSGGDAKFTMWLDIAGIYGIGIPMAFLGGVALKLPIHWVYLMLQTEEVFKAFLGMRRYLSGKWLNRLTRDEPMADETEKGGISMATEANEAAS